MNIKRTYVIKDGSIKVSERVINYFMKRGYQNISGDSLLEFKRGSVLGSLLSFSPAKWGCRVKVKINEKSEVMAEFDVNTIGQIVTSRERSFWMNEAGQLEKAIAGRKYSAESAKELAGKAFRLNLKYLLAFVLFLIICSLIVRIVTLFI